MFSRYAVFVDAGYLYAASSEALNQRVLPRKNVKIVDVRKLMSDLTTRASAQAGNAALLRVYWYDAMLSANLSLEQSTLAHEPGLKLRLGTVNHAGEQKGVDSLIVTDLIELARNKAIADAILLSGDEDLRIAVQLAQSFGVKVHLLGVGNVQKNVSRSLQMEADSVESLDSAWLSQHIEIVGDAKLTIPGEKGQVSPAKLVGQKDVRLSEAAGETATELLSGLASSEQADLKAHFQSSTGVPPEFDKRLIAKTAARLGRSLTQDEKREIRGVFVNKVRSL